MKNLTLALCVLCASFITAPTKTAFAKERNITFVGKEGTKVRLPVIFIKASYGIDFAYTVHPYPDAPFPPIHYTVPENQVRRLEVYWMNSGDNRTGYMVLGPRGWMASGMVGADGSSAVTLTDGQDKRFKLYFMQDGACQGCAMSNIATYFPEQSKHLGGPLFPSVVDFAHRVEINQHTLAYQLQNATNGVAVYAETSRTNYFGREEVSLPTSEAALATTILNFYIFQSAHSNQ